MTNLGEAQVDVVADMRPFIRDLDATLLRASEAFETRIRGGLVRGLGGADGSGEELGDQLGAGVERGLRRRVGQRGKSPWVSIAAAFASALDDGLSALPTEVKAGIVAGLVAVSPLVSGFIGAAIIAGLGVGLAGIGTLLAFQFQQVEDAGHDFVERLRLQLITAASAFIPAVLKGLDQITVGFQRMGPVINRIFTAAADFVEPLIRGTLEFIDQLLTGIDVSTGDIQGFVEEAGRALKTLGFALGEVIRILAGTGDKGREAFRDMIFLLGVLAINVAQVVALFTEFYASARDLAEILDYLVFPAALFIAKSDEAAQTGFMWARANRDIADSSVEVIKATEEEEKRFRELTKAIDGASKAVYGMIETQMDFEESVDRITAALKENGDTLDITTEKGRENVGEFLKGLKAAEEQTLNQIAVGKLSAQQAAEFYNLQIEKLRELGNQGGITDQEFNNLYGNIVAVAQLKLDAAAMGIINTESELSDATRQAASLYHQMKLIQGFRLPSVGTRRFSEYADGGILHGPTVGMFGEAGPEVVIPLTRPQRAAQLMQQSGLADMLGGNGTVVNVYVGNEQLDARTYRIVEANNSALSSSVAFGARGL